MKIWEGVYDGAILNKEAKAAEYAAKAGNPPDRPATPITKKAADRKGIPRNIWSANGTSAPAPRRSQPRRGPKPLRLSSPPRPAACQQEDHAALAKMPPEARAVVEREYAANQQAMAPVNALKRQVGRPARIARRDHGAAASRARRPRA